MSREDAIRVSQTLDGTGGRLDYAEHLCDVASKLPDNAIIIEIGTQNGGSAATMGTLLKERNVKIYCVDPCFIKTEDRPESYKVYENIGGYSLDGVRITFENLGLANNIVCLPGSSEDVLAKWGGEKFDMLFIDGDHTYNGAMIDMMWLQYAKDKCILMLDDWISEVQRACEQRLGQFPGFSQRADGSYFPMYYTRGY